MVWGFGFGVEQQFMVKFAGANSMYFGMSSMLV